MAVQTVKKYNYEKPISVESPPFFQVESVSMDTSCVINRSHQAEHYKIFYIEKGDGDYQIDFQKFSIHGAGIFFLSPGQTLTIDAEKFKFGYRISFNRDFYCVQMHGKEIACNGVLFNNVHRAAFLQLEHADKETFCRQVQSMIDELKNPGPAHQEMLETYLRLFLIESLRIQSKQNIPAAVEEDSKSATVSEFITLVDTHFREIHAVSGYAEKLFITPKSLSKRLKAHNYKTPTEVIRDRIVLEAKRDLLYSDKSVQEIAYDLGFEDPAYFGRVFKKAAGVSPQGFKTEFAG